tara:strand:+ start:5056 stop:5418 length:363 start_codon:yes stop_codon:yes gene_type:complete
MFDTITKDNWMLYAMKNYDNPTVEKEEEFHDDLKRFKYLKRLFRKYDLTNELKVRLVVNHIVVLQNVFGAEACVTLLLYHIERKHWPVIKPVLDYLKYIHPTELNEVESDKNILKLLEDI